MSKALEAYNLGPMQVVWQKEADEGPVMTACLLHPSCVLAISETLEEDGSRITHVWTDVQVFHFQKPIAEVVASLFPVRLSPQVLRGLAIPDTAPEQIRDEKEAE